MYKQVYNRAFCKKAYKYFEIYAEFIARIFKPDFCNRLYKNSHFQKYY